MRVKSFSRSCSSPYCSTARVDLFSWVCFSNLLSSICCLETYWSKGFIYFGVFETASFGNGGSFDVAFVFGWLKAFETWANFASISFNVYCGLDYSKRLYWLVFFMLTRFGGCTVSVRFECGGVLKTKFVLRADSPSIRLCSVELNKS